MKGKTMIQSYGLNELGYTIFLDRYANKDPQAAKNLQVGDVVIAIIDNNSKDTKQRRSVAEVVKMWDADEYGKTLVTVLLWIEGIEYDIDITLIDRPLETSPDQMWRRIASGVSACEDDALKSQVESDFYSILKDWRFVPGGRIMAGAGTGVDLTLLNCFVIPMLSDSRSGIFDTIENMAELMARGGGVGINYSVLRPKNSYVAGVNGRASGAVSFAGLGSYVTGLIEQAGSRRGAKMAILNDWHPDIISFINSKREAGNITNANISVGISDEFMDAVKSDTEWVLRFPDTSHPQYDSEWEGIIEHWESKGYPVVVYQTILARELWNMIVESAWASAEPGIWFRSRANKMSNSHYYPGGYLLATNPCAEQSLSAYSACNLGAINLSKYVSYGFLQLDELRRDTAIAVRFLDNVNDVTNYHLPEVRVKQKSERRIGLGVMGLAEAMILCDVRYGSPESVDFIDLVFSTMRDSAYITSSELSKEKGCFPLFEAQGFLSSGFAMTLPENVREHIRRDGIRNVTLLTVAPTGSGGTMVNTSTGLEPFFSWQFWRKGRLGYFAQNVPIYEAWLSEQPEGAKLDVPKRFVTAMELSPYEHVDVMAQIQKYVDSSLSKTVNAPNDWTTAQVSDLYQYMYDMGCKGGTIYRAGSRSEQVLATSKEGLDAGDQKPDAPSKTEPLKVSDALYSTTFSASPEARPVVLKGNTFKGATPYGVAYITINETSAGVPYEAFITVGKSGSDLAAQAETIGRMISTSLRSVPSFYRFTAMSNLVGQMEGIGGGTQVGLGSKRVLSFPDAIAKIIRDNYLVVANEDASDDAVSVVLDDSYQVSSSPVFKGASMCPECGNLTMIREEGCYKCGTCGYSKC
jgi:ribonucleoside-diphosphate reductase alpha chain